MKIPANIPPSDSPANFPQGSAVSPKEANDLINLSADAIGKAREILGASKGKKLTPESVDPDKLSELKSLLKELSDKLQALSKRKPAEEVADLKAQVEEIQNAVNKAKKELQKGSSIDQSDMQAIASQLKELASSLKALAAPA